MYLLWLYTSVNKAQYMIQSITTLIISIEIVFNKKNPSNLFLSREIDGIFEVEKKTRSEEGDWKTETVTSNSTIDNLRPYVVSGNSDSSSFLFWMQGKYYHYTNFETNLIIKEIDYQQ